LIQQAALAIGAAHRAGVIHRDLKPENILVEATADQERVKVLDFGAARLTDESGSQLTKSGAVFGTAHYMSPEAARGEPVGAPADVYALTTMLYELLVGSPPFDGTSPVAILIQHATAKVPPLDEARPGVALPAGLSHLVARNLSKQPEERAVDAQTLGESLARLYSDGTSESH
jgi:serine/threonine-protein kinase